MATLPRYFPLPHLMDMAAYNYNYVRAIEYTWRVCYDLITLSL